MDNISYRYCIGIPLWEDGGETLEYGIVEKNVLLISLTDDKADCLYPIFSNFVKTFRSIIDCFEEEIVTNENISKAIEIVSYYLEKQEETFVATLRKLMQALLKA